MITVSLSQQGRNYKIINTDSNTEIYWPVSLTKIEFSNDGSTITLKDVSSNEIFIEVSNSGFATFDEAKEHFRNLIQ